MTNGALSNSEIPQNPPRSKPQVIDLFAGVGGLSLGIARAGFQLALAVELDKHAMRAHKVNFPKTKHLEHDIDDLTGNDVMREAGLQVGELDGLIGGPPCQGFSVIGRRSAGDPRNNLFVKFFELAMQCRPKFFVVENVPGVLDKKYDDIRDNAFQQVTKEYILLDPMKLKASNFGAPTSRERVFFVGYRRDVMDPLTVDEFNAQAATATITVGTALHGLPQDICPDWLTEEASWRPVQAMPDSLFTRQIASHIPNGVGNAASILRYQEKRQVSGCFGTRHSTTVEKRYDELKPGEQDRVSKSVRLKLDGLCPTLRAGTGAERGSFQAVRPIHPTLPRVITPREGARLQGFPDWFQFASSKWQSFRQIGNSVSPILAEAVFKIIYDHLRLPKEAGESYE